MRRKTLEERLEKYLPNKSMQLWRLSNYRAKTRLQSKVIELLEQPHAYFITFTIAPKHHGLKLNTYIRKVKEALRETSDYVANEDYGNLNGRYHIHALACFSEQYDYTIKPNTFEKIWQYGIIHFEPIYKRNDEALSNYMNKLSQHATKETAHKIIYGRKKQ